MQAVQHPAGLDQPGCQRVILARTHQVGAALPPGFRQVGQGDQGVAPIIARADQRQDAILLHIAIDIQDGIRQAAPGVFHHLFIAQTGRIGLFLDCNHLRDGK